MSQHTTGEWTLNKKNNRIIECDGNKILTAAATPWDKPEAWANARLAKASPDLLEALKAAMRCVESEGHPFRSWHNLAMEAIAKAEGTP